MELRMLFLRKKFFHKFRQRYGKISAILMFGKCQIRKDEAQKSKKTAV